MNRAILALLATLAAGCATPSRVNTSPLPPETCRASVSPDGRPSAQGVRWIRPESGLERMTLDAWCYGVGPAVVAPEQAVPSASGSADDLAVVSWNVHVGAGDVLALVEQLRSGRLTDGRRVDHFVLLLQEAYRAGSLVPRGERAGLRAPRRIRPRTARERMDVVDVAAALGLALYYVPSMRNGDPRQTEEDRGNAILSTEGMSELSAIEFPFERQRRVGLEATIRGKQSSGESWTLRVANVHLDSLGSARRLWVFATGARLRQARGLLRAMSGDMPAVLGGDFNTWFGVHEPAYREIAKSFTEAPHADPRPTFGVLRLDHLLFDLSDTWQARTVRIGRFGSDHYALLAHLRLRPGPERPTAH